MNKTREQVLEDEAPGWGTFGGAGPAPGKSTLTSRLSGRPASARDIAAELAMIEREPTAHARGARPGSGWTTAPAVQRAASAASAQSHEDPFAVHLQASKGVSGGATTLPHREAIQRSFGHHDVSGIRAHVGGEAAVAAASIGALAYATGDSVAFAAAPDLRQAAHEAAHVVQQRGGVRLDGGVGRAGDAYEQHADAVADLAMRGESAESLLDTMAHRGAAGGAAVQRLDAREVEANVLSLTSSSRDGALDERSQRRTWERLCQLDPSIHVEDWDSMTAGGEREAALHDAITRFQDSESGSAMIDEIAAANGTEEADGSGLLYERPERPADRLANFAAHRAELHPGEILANDITAQALANVWPQSVLGRMMDESQAYQALAAVVVARGLDFFPDGVNVIGVRAYQGGAVHDNDEELIYTDRNRYNDTQFIVWKDDREHHVRQARGTVDPGGPRARPARSETATDAPASTSSAAGSEASSADSARAARPDLTFAVAADQEWTYSGNPHGRSSKFDRAIYGMPDPGTVRRGRHWTEHPDEVLTARARTHGGGRIIHRSDGRLETDRDAAGDARLVSAVHSGGNGGTTGDRVFGDSTGCSVVHGSWFAHFNESLAAATAATGATDPATGVARFTYALIDPRMFGAGELDALLDPIAPSASATSASAPSAAPAPASASSAAPATPVVQRDGEIAEPDAGERAAVEPDAGERAAVEPDAGARAPAEPAGEAEAVASLRDEIPEVAAAEPALRDYDSAFMVETRTRFAIPARGWRDRRAADGRERVIDLSRSLRSLVERVRTDPATVAHIRETLDWFYNDPDPHSRLSPGDIDVSLVLAIANRESMGDPRLTSTGDTRVITAGRDTHRDGIGGLDYVGNRLSVRDASAPDGHSSLFPSAIRDEVIAVQDDPTLRAGLRPNRTRANPAELPERDLLAAYIVEIRFRTEMFEREYREHAERFLTAAEVEQLWNTLGTDARRAWIQAAFGSRLGTLLTDVLVRFRRAMRSGDGGDDGFASALADDNVNLNAITTVSAVIDAAGLSGHRTRVSAAEAAMLDASLPAELLHH